MLQCERDGHGNTRLRSSGLALALSRVFGKTMIADLKALHFGDQLTWEVSEHFA